MVLTIAHGKTDLSLQDKSMPQLTVSARTQASRTLKYSKKVAYMPVLWKSRARHKITAYK